MLRPTRAESQDRVPPRSGTTISTGKRQVERQIGRRCALEGVDVDPLGEGWISNGLRRAVLEQQRGACVESDGGCRAALRDAGGEAQTAATRLDVLGGHT